jgi:hypothetical protein
MVNGNIKSGYLIIERMKANDKHAGCERCLKPARLFLYRIGGYHELGCFCYYCAVAKAKEIMRSEAEDNQIARIHAEM